MSDHEIPSTSEDEEEEQEQEQEQEQEEAEELEEPLDKFKQFLVSDSEEEEEEEAEEEVPQDKEESGEGDESTTGSDESSEYDSELEGEGEEESEVEGEEKIHIVTSEELRIKAEEERLFAESEARKEEIRKPLRLLKARFRILKRRNQELPAPVRFTKEDFIIDDRPSEARREADEEKLIEYYRVQEFDAAKQFIQMQKIRSFFFSRFETHYTIVKDLEHTAQVSTFRLQSLSPEFWKLMQQNQIWLQEEEESQKKSEEVVEEAIETREPVKRFYAKDLIGDFEGKSYKINTVHAIKHLETRLEKRYKRECEIAELDAVKIPEDWEAPEDVEAIKIAESTIGDYKLKEDENFSHENLSTHQIRQKILELKLEMYQKMHTFNKLIVLLKDEKPAIILQVNELLKELTVLQKYLPAKLRKPLPIIYELESCEQPEKVFDITRDDVDARIEKKVTELGFGAQKEAMEKKLYGVEEVKETPPCLNEIPDVYKSKAYNPEIDMFLVHPKQPSQANMKNLTCRTFAPKIQPLPTIPVGKKGQTFDGLQRSIYKFRQLFFEAKNEPDKLKRDAIINQRKYKQQLLYDKLYKKINYYKNRMLALIDEKVHLEMNLKLMQITLMNLFEELDISKEYDIEEAEWLEKLKKQQGKCAKSKDKADKIKKRLQHFKDELEKIETNIAQNQKEVTFAIGKKHRFSDYLWKLFKRKIDVSKEDEDEEDAQNASSNPSSSSSSSSSSIKSQERLSKHKYDYICCPDGLDKETYDKICELRSKHRHLQIEFETQTEIVNRVIKRSEEIDADYEKHECKLGKINNEIKVLSRRKQERLNDIDKVIIIKAHQIECMDEKKMDEIDGNDFEQNILTAFQSPDEVLVISNGITNCLDDRAEELKNETKIGQEKLRRARHLLRRVQEELLKKQKIVTKLETTCKHDMVQKFGRVVDLDQISAAIINLELLNALSKLEARRKEQIHEQHLFKKEIDVVKDKLMDVTKINSELNTLVAILEERQRDIEYYQHLQGKNDKQVTMELIDQHPSYEISGSREIRQKNEDVFDELGRLEDVLWEQDMKIGVLRSVISMCKTKHGVPLLIPLKTVPRTHNIAEKYVTYEEIQHQRMVQDKNIIMLYKKDEIIQDFQKSTSEVPFTDQELEFENEHHHHHQRHSHNNQEQLQSVEEEDTFNEEEEEEEIGEEQEEIDGEDNNDEYFMEGEEDGEQEGEDEFFEDEQEEE